MCLPITRVCEEGGGGPLRVYNKSYFHAAPQKLSSYMYARLLLVIAGMVLLALGYWWRCCMPSVQRSVYKDIGIGMNWRNNNVISSYVRGTQEQLVDLMDSGDGVRLMFATGECGNETWAGLSAEQFAKVNIPLLNYRGIQYTVSANCSAFTCNSTNGAENFLKRYLGTHLQGFDFYFPQDMQPSDQQLSNLMRNIMSLQQNNTKLTISFSFVSSATTESIGNLGTSVLTAARYAGLKFIVNLMTMNYGPKPSEEFCVVDDNQKCDMGASAIQAAKNLNLFYKVPFTEIALTPMIGMNDITNEIFTIADMKKVLEFGAKVGLAGLHYWSFDRDCQCPPDSPVAASLYCSGVQQEPLQYYNLFMGHGNTEL